MIFIFPSILTHQLQLLLQAFRSHNHSLYNFYRDQSYILVDGKYRRRDKDHESVIGYDDMNQLFWYSKGLERLVLADKKSRLMSLPPGERYEELNQVLWNRVFYKTLKKTEAGLMYW